MAVYFIIKKEIFDVTLPETQDITAPAPQRTYAVNLFTQTDERLASLSDFSHFLRSTSAFPAIHISIIKQLDFLRRHLLSQYHIVEKDVSSIDKNCAGELYKIFHDMFMAIADDDKHRNLRVRPFTPVEVVLQRMWDNLDPARKVILQFRDPARPSSLGKRSRDDANGNDVGPSPNAGEQEVSESERSSKRVRMEEHRDQASSPPQRRRPYLPRKAKTKAQQK